MRALFSGLIKNECFLNFIKEGRIPKLPPLLTKPAVAFIGKNSASSA
jgi:hypothetical protein